MDSRLKRDLRRRIVKSLIIHAIVVTAIVTTNCRQQRAVETIAVKKAPAPLEIVIHDTLSKEDIKLMPLACHSTQVPEGTLIGDTVTARDGFWISNQNYMRVAVVLRLFERESNK